jgi:hypothetical protein
MLPLRDLEEIIGCCCCAASSCDNSFSEVYITLEGREIPLCSVHYQMIASETLW